MTVGRPARIGDFDRLRKPTGRSRGAAPHFDRRGNAGTTAWADGRVVGCWTQDEHGAVHAHPLYTVRTSTRRALDIEAELLSAWLDGVRINTGYRSPAMRAAPATNRPTR